MESPGEYKFIPGIFFQSERTATDPCKFDSVAAAENHHHHQLADLLVQPTSHRINGRNRRGVLRHSWTAIRHTKYSHRETQSRRDKLKSNLIPPSEEKTINFCFGIRSEEETFFLQSNEMIINPVPLY